MSIANQIDQFLGTIMQFAENKHEILLGKCESDVKLTSTQEHILMILAARFRQTRELPKN
ncbi:Transcriptional regulator ZitR [Lactococcus lactis]|nr:Transcriptional regulator ZitR [Lactococcus lactis]